MVIKSKESKISKYSKLVDKYLNVVYELQNDIDDLEVNYIMELLEDAQADIVPKLGPLKPYLIEI